MSSSAPSGRSGLDTAEVLDILSRTDDSDLTEIVRLVASICESDAAGITIRRGSEFHMPIAHGIEPLVCADETFCHLSMDTEGPFVIEDARTDPRLAGSGWMKGRLATARFYASTPLHAPTGEMVGRLCVIDPAPKSLSPLQVRALETLALSVTKLIELRLLRSVRTTTPVSAEGRQTAATVTAQLAAELSHDLRVPLSSIIASVEMLEEELGEHRDRTVSALLDQLTRATERMLRMLDQTMAHGIAGSEIVRRDVDLGRLTRLLILDTAGLLESSGATVEYADLPVVHADPHDMYSVLQNLLTNSVKFARPGLPAHVQISARRTTEGWRISVRDNGIGIPEHRRVDVFSLFSRVDSDVAGHGIGLATVARIVAAHGGRAGVENNSGGGTEVWFELPDVDPVTDETTQV